MGKVADKTHLQIKMLNSAKGPAVQSLRAQGDKIAYPKEMLNYLNSLENLTIKEGMVEDLIVEDKKVKGIILEDGDKVILFPRSKDGTFKYSNNPESYTWNEIFANTDDKFTKLRKKIQSYRKHGK